MADAMNLDWLELEPTGENSYRAQRTRAPATRWCSAGSCSGR